MKGETKKKAMGKGIQFKGELHHPDGHKVRIHLDLLQFREEGSTFIYAPYLDLYGYGKNADEAKSSFQTALEEFFTYTRDKGTFDQEMKRLGWKKKDAIYIPPKLNTSDPEIQEILSDHHPRLYQEHVEVPA